MDMTDEVIDGLAATEVRGVVSKLFREKFFRSFAIMMSIPYFGSALLAPTIIFSNPFIGAWFCLISYYILSYMRFKCYNRSFIAYRTEFVAKVLQAEKPNWTKFSKSITPLAIVTLVSVGFDVIYLTLLWVHAANTIAFYYGT